MDNPTRSNRKSIALSSGVIVAIALAGVFFAGRVVWFTLPLLVGGIVFALSLASLIGRGYFSTAVVMAAGAFLAFPEKIADGGLDASPGGVLFIICALAALLLAIAGLHHRFGARAARRIGTATFVLLGFGLAYWMMSSRVIAETAVQYDAALDACAGALKPEDADTGTYKHLSSRATDWHDCARTRACAAQDAYAGALCRLALAPMSRQLRAMRRAGARVIVAETREKYMPVIATCGTELAGLSGFETVPDYINAHPENPDYQERIEWDLLECGIDRVCEQYREQQGVSEESCSAAYKALRETENVSPRLVLMRKYSKE
ncbi:MAG TPA: hypothetical protein VEF76_02800 [Patescibacteria group bacterium]|nr:hypothetical protein [Patescibacteria group bacterium]